MQLLARMHVLASGLASAVAFDAEPGVDYSGHGMDHPPLFFTTDDYDQCHAACATTAGCVGWSYKPVHAVNGSAANTCTTNINGTKRATPACWLKWAMTAPLGVK